jgi:transposase-like protein
MAEHHPRTQNELVQEVLLEDPDFLKEIVRKVLSSRSWKNRDDPAHRSCPLYERTEDRKGPRNAYEPRTLNTRVGTLELLVPRDREGTFSTQLFARYQPNEKAPVLALMEMYTSRGCLPGRSRTSPKPCVALLSARAQSRAWPAASIRS